MAFLPLSKRVVGFGLKEWDTKDDWNGAVEKEEREKKGLAVIKGERRMGFGEKRDGRRSGVSAPSLSNIAVTGSDYLRFFWYPMR